MGNIINAEKGVHSMYKLLDSMDLINLKDNEINKLTNGQRTFYINRCDEFINKLKDSKSHYDEKYNNQKITELENVRKKLESTMP